MAKVYLVVGSTGEYSDHTQWTVCAYGDAEQAELHVAALRKAVEGLKGHWRHEDEEDEGEVKAEAIRRTLDPSCDVDCTGVFYEVHEVDLWRHFDEFQGLE